MPEKQLEYVTDAAAGITRRRAGRGFVYLDRRGRRIVDAGTLTRIRELAVPPAWTDVWICPRPMGHLQATGRDARGRKQYVYHDTWRTLRDEIKFGRVLDLADHLPRIRERVERDLRRRGLARETVAGLVVRLLDTTLIRVGNDEYVRDNGSFGLTTLRSRHVELRGATIRFRFRGKAGTRHDVSVSDRPAARLVRRCLDLPGDPLFRYLDGEEQPRSLDSQAVNDYLRSAAGNDFAVTAKDFRTWHGTVLAAWALKDEGPPAGKTAARRSMSRAVEHVAERLGNTPAVCRACYVHPDLFDAYLDGDLAALHPDAAAQRPADLSPLERPVIRLLDRRGAGSSSEIAA